MKKIAIETAPKAMGPYSQAIVVDSGKRLVFVSGQLPIDLATGKLMEADIRAMTHKVIDHIEAILIASGSSLQAVIRSEVFLKDIKKDFVPMNEEYAKRFGGQITPARQTIQVADLPLGSPIEISCIAVID